MRGPRFVPGTLTSSESGSTWPGGPLCSRASHASNPIAMLTSLFFYIRVLFPWMVVLFVVLAFVSSLR